MKYARCIWNLNRSSKSNNRKESYVPQKNRLQNQTNRQPLIEVFATHKNPGTDELSAFRTLELTGGNGALRIARKPRYKFITVGNSQIGPVPDNALLVGVGGEKSWADEHGKGLKDSSAFKLVLERIGLLESLCFRTIENRITREDRYGAEKVRSHISQVVKDLYDMGVEFAEVYAWYCVFFDAVIETERTRPRDEKPIWFGMDLNSCTRIVKLHYGEEESIRWREFGIAAVKGMQSKFIEAQRALADKSQFRTIQTYLGEKVIFAPLEVQENVCFAKAAKSLGADIVVIQTRFHESAVGTMISVSPKSGLSLENVVVAIRQHELLHRQQLDSEIACQLAGEGTLEICEYWHALETGEETKGQCHLLLSGTKTRPDGEKTIMSIEYIIDIVEGMLMEEVAVIPEKVEPEPIPAVDPPVVVKAKAPLKKAHPKKVFKKMIVRKPAVLSLDHFLAPRGLEEVLRG